MSSKIGYFRGENINLTQSSKHDTAGFPVMKSLLPNLSVVVFLIAASWILGNWRRNDFMICNGGLVFFLWTSNLLHEANVWGRWHSNGVISFLAKAFFLLKDCSQQRISKYLEDFISMKEYFEIVDNKNWKQCETIEAIKYKNKELNQHKGFQCF